MNLSQVKPPSGQVKKQRRIGQGMGSGRGKFSGRGAKGARSVSGYSKMRGFEGGQMPLHRRVPKRGFNNIFRVEYVVVNLDTLGEVFEAGSAVTPDVLRERGIVRETNAPVKVLGRGEITKALTIKAHKFSESAVKKIAAAGGVAEVIG